MFWEEGPLQGADWYLEESPDNSMQGTEHKLRLGRASVQTLILLNGVWNEF